MPESAEVKLTTEFLHEALENELIISWDFVSGQYRTKLALGFEQFKKGLPITVLAVKCKGKFIYFECTTRDKKPLYILHHLRLTGSWRNVLEEKCRWVVQLQSGRKLWYYDSRCLGILQFTTEKSDLNAQLCSLGPDILTEQFNLECWRKLVQSYAGKNVTAFLMDQSIISGCGNYIKAEALYEAKISPFRKVGSLSENEAEQLFQAIRMIPRRAYVGKGMTKRDYTDPQGNKTDYRFELKIYGTDRAKKEKTPDGRMTHWDPEHQK